ncbi:MAG: response regulator [Alphaproteobacteria bacterium]|nr:response regulator [Alphaproteobacteria bacterium]
MAKIVCVEDEADIREDLVETLELAGYTVISAENGQVGLEMIEREKPDLVISDITMPVLDGLGLLAAVRSGHEELADMPFIFLSALADRNDMIQGHEQGADEYLTKPVDFDLLHAVVKAKLQQSERVRKMRDRQLLKMYGALTRTPIIEDAAMASTPPDGKRLNIISISSDDADLAEIHEAIQAAGHALFQMHSGTEFSNTLDDVSPDLLMITFETRDIQAPALVKLLREAGDYAFPVILFLPPSAPEFPGDGKLPTVDVQMRLPADMGALLQYIADLSRHLHDSVDLLAAG